MKKVLSVILALLIIGSMTACNAGTESSAKDTALTTAPIVQDTALATEPTPEPSTIPTTEPSANTIRSDFKAAMDSYEAFFDEYVAIMKKYKENPTDISILADYANYMGQYTDMMQKFEQWESEDLSSEELAYYLDVQTRITKKLLEVA